ncbi:SLC13 family permease [Peptoniphilus sp. GNH]|nr:SLC13 family permease [Peptoniphilus sp. GNH]
MNTSTIAIIILFFTIVSFVWGKIPLAITALSSAILMGIFKVIPFKVAFSGFSNDVTLMVIGSMIIGEAVFETGAADKIGRSIIKIVGYDEKKFIVACILLTAILSALLSNTAVVAMMLPVVAAVSKVSKGKIKKKNLYMAIGFAANVGGGMTLVGSTPNVVGQGMLIESGIEGMKFFDLTLGSIPRLIFMVIFYITIGVRLQNKIFNFEEIERRIDSNNENTNKSTTNIKMILSVVIMILMIVGFISEIWTVGTVAMVAGIFCIVTGCISLKAVFERIDWNTIWILAGSFGFAAGLSESGAGELIANRIISMLGADVSLYKLLIIFTIISVILSNIMSSTASSAMICPIAISMCQVLNLPAKPVIMAIVWGLNLAFLTPVATPPVTMTLQAGYRFLDYTKIGSILMIGSLIITILIYPLVFSL